MPDSVVEIVYQNGIWRFTPRVAEAARTVLIFFPGALVDPRAYAPLARSVAEAGYPVVVVELPRRGAFGGADSPELATRIGSVVSTMGAERQIVVGGHSRGSVVATRMAAENRAALAGLVIIGSSHPRDVDLSSLEVPVTKIVGTRDGLASPDEVRENAGLLPRQTRWIWIEGGNHSQFGWYGFQPLDRRPRIEASKQRAVMLKGVLEVMDTVNRRAVDRHISLQPHAVALPDPITRPLVIYLEATAAELDSARRGVSDEDFAVIADDLMFYRSTALEQLEARQIPFSRISGRRPLKFVVAGSSKTVNPNDHALFDLIVVFRGDDTARVFAPNEVDQAADYWLRSSISRDTAK